MRSSARHERPAAELGKGVMPSIGRDDIVSRLRAAVVAHNSVGLRGAGQIIYNAAFSGVPITQVCDQDGCVVLFVHLFLRRVGLLPRIGNLSSGAKVYAKLR